MEAWLRALRAGVASGVWAATLSTLVVAVRAREEEGDPAGAVAAPSKWLLGDGAAQACHPSAVRMLLGHAVHTGATVFWAVLF